MNFKSYNISKLFIYFSFSFFFLLSFRLVFVCLSNTPPWMFVFVTFAILVASIISWWRTDWILFLFIICVPLVSGLQLIFSDFFSISYLKKAPILSLTFAIIYLSWCLKQLLWNKKDIRSNSVIGNLIDFLAIIVALSLIISLCEYPIGIVWLKFQSFPFNGQNETFWKFQASYILLQGLFLFRLLEIEISSERWKKRIGFIFFCHALIIIFFSIIQYILNIPIKKFGLIHSPFNDIHSYGSYVTLLFFVFLQTTTSSVQKHKFRLILTLLLFLCVLLCGSFTSLLVLIIIGCFYFLNKFRFVLISVVICFIIFGLLYFNFIPSVLNKFDNPSLKRYSERLTAVNIKKKISGRIMSADQAFGILRAYPITGSGIGTFYKNSRYYHLSKTAHPKRKENAHNYYLQFAAELGIPAILILLCIIYYTYKIGSNALNRSKNDKYLRTGLLFGISAYLATMFTGHPLLLSNQQFLFWFIISAITLFFISTKEFISLKKNKFILKKILLPVFTILLVIGHSYNLFARDSGLRGYEYGFYNYENHMGNKMRWTMDKSCMRINKTDNLIGLSLFSSSHNIDSEGLLVDLIVNEEVFERIHFFEKDVKHCYFFISSINDKEIEIKTIVNKCFNPYALGISKDFTKNREQGIAVSPAYFLKIMPIEGIGFYEWETWNGAKINDLPYDTPLKYRNTGMRASISVDYADDDTKKYSKSGKILFFKCDHPDIDKNPVVLKIFGDDNLIKKTTFVDHQWKNIFIDPERLVGVRVLTFHLNRTWNPKLYGVSNDIRDLGIAVAIIK